jgi:myo-inositol-1(or 4)-monophosphatase
MILEAGGLVGDLQGNDDFMESGDIVAGNPKIFVQLLQVIEGHLTPALRQAAASSSMEQGHGHDVAR